MFVELAPRLIYCFYRAFLNKNKYALNLKNIDHEHFELFLSKILTPNSCVENGWYKVFQLPSLRLYKLQSINRFYLGMYHKLIVFILAYTII